MLYVPFVDAIAPQNHCVPFLWPLLLPRTIHACMCACVFFLTTASKIALYGFMTLASVIVFYYTFFTLVCAVYIRFPNPCCTFFRRLLPNEHHVPLLLVLASKTTLFWRLLPNEHHVPFLGTWFQNWNQSTWCGRCRALSGVFIDNVCVFCVCVCALWGHGDSFLSVWPPRLFQQSSFPVICTYRTIHTSQHSRFPSPFVCLCRHVLN